MTDCRKISESLEALADGRLNPAEQAAIDRHMAGCDSCATAWQAFQALQAHAKRAVPAPRPELFAEVIQLAAQTEMLEHRPAGSRFWIGAGMGGAIAAGIVFALLSFGGILQEQVTPGTPQLTIALNETRDVNVAINSPLELQQAQIRVVLTGAVALAGFDGQSEIHWSVNLDRGVNMLTLPVTMQGLSGGRVLVEVNHEDRHEIFVVYVRGAPEVGASMQPVKAVDEPAESQV